jgi:hypothetical protein
MRQGGSAEYVWSPSFEVITPYLSVGNKASCYLIF